MIGIHLPRNQAIEQAAMAGRRGDTALAHLTPGEVVIPRSAQTPNLMASFASQMRRQGANPAQYIVGSRMPSINPSTGLQEFADPVFTGRYNSLGQPIYDSAPEDKVQPAITPTDALNVGSNFLPKDFLGLNTSGDGTGLFSGVGNSISGFMGTNTGIGGIGEAQAQMLASQAAELDSAGAAAGADASLVAAPEAGAEGAAVGGATFGSVLGGAGMGAAIGGIVGPNLFGGSEIGSTIGGGIGGAAGMAFGGAAATALGMELGAFGGPIGMVAGAILGSAIGGLFGGGGVHHVGGGAHIGVNDKGQLAVDNVVADNFDPSGVKSAASGYADQFNQFMGKYGVSLKGNDIGSWWMGGDPNVSGTPGSWQNATSNILGNGNKLVTGDPALDAEIASKISAGSPAPTFGSMLGVLGTDITRFRAHENMPTVGTSGSIDWAHYGQPGTTEQVLSNAPQFMATTGPKPAHA